MSPSSRLSRAIDIANHLSHRERKKELTSRFDPVRQLLRNLASDFFGVSPDSLQEAARARGATPPPFPNDAMGEEMDVDDADVEEEMGEDPGSAGDEEAAPRKHTRIPATATKVLNAWFMSHLSSPYPRFEEKAALAKLCDLTPLQVCNWFGNKRIRFKRMMSEATSGSQAKPSESEKP